MTSHGGPLAKVEVPRPAGEVFGEEVQVALEGGQDGCLGVHAERGCDVHGERSVRVRGDQDGDDGDSGQPCKAPGRLAAAHPLAQALALDAGEGVGRVADEADPLAGAQAVEQALEVEAAVGKAWAEEHAVGKALAPEEEEGLGADVAAWRRIGVVAELPEDGVDPAEVAGVGTEDDRPFACVPEGFEVLDSLRAKGLEKPGSRAMRKPLVLIIRWRIGRALAAARTPSERP